MGIKQRKDEAKEKIKRMGAGKIIVLLIMTLGTICAYVFHDKIFSSGSIFLSGVTSSEFLNGLLAVVPNLIKGIQVVTIGLLILTVVLFILKKTFKNTKRGVTVCRLVCNIVKVVTIIILLITVLAIWGIDTTALITGAGVVTLIVGLGMQSLISDVVAGLFIIFENEFNVGDIITVDGFRGTVVEIGIRTTKLEALGNIKIINNSDIRNVLNQTLQPSTAKALIDIEYEMPVEKAEKIIAEKLPDLKIEGALEAISYDGVAELGASGVTLQFTTKCAEGDIFAVQRLMNRELKKMFEDNGIEIPYNQLVVHVDK